MARDLSTILESSGFSVRGLWEEYAVGMSLFGFGMSLIFPIEQRSGHSLELYHKLEKLVRNLPKIKEEGLRGSMVFRKRTLEIPSKPGALGLPETAVKSSACVMGSVRGLQTEEGIFKELLE